MAVGHKIFVSYKYADNDVQPLLGEWESTTARSYVNKLESILSDAEHIYKGEHDGEDLSEFADETVWSELRNKIFDSTVTIILISPNMKEFGEEKDQWIPQEVRFPSMRRIGMDMAVR